MPRFGWAWVLAGACAFGCATSGETAGSFDEAGASGRDGTSEDVGASADGEAGTGGVDGAADDATLDGTLDGMDASGDSAAADGAEAGEAGGDAGPPMGGCDAGATMQAGSWWWWPCSATGWTISNVQPDSASEWDCCGCSPCMTCESGGTNHRYDGFTAVYRSVPVLQGQGCHVEIGVVGLHAYIAGATGSENASVWDPTWGLEVHSGGTVLASFQQPWGTAQCQTCTPNPSSLGVFKVPFVAPTSINPTSSIDLYLYAHNASSQCAAEAYGDEVDVSYIAVTCP
jgi:hypothetical protein